MAYMSIDLFDSTQAIIAARNNNLFFTNGQFNVKDLDEIPCSCPICSKYNGKTVDMSFNKILNHNYHVFLNEIKNVRNSIKNSSIRELVENRITAHPNLISILRYLDKKHYTFLESKTPTVSNKELIVTSKETLNRPEIRRFQERILNRYIKPKSCKILLLLPCSAKKPYSFSKTHKIFRDQILNSQNPNVIHELIITSPIGLVPRELELVYPASMYDISVTGFWDEDEKKMIRTNLRKYLEKNKYDVIISHLEDNLLDFIKDILIKYHNTCVDKPTSKKSLEKLRKTLDQKSKPYGKISDQIRKKENIQSLASYQFNKKIAKKLVENTVIKGRYPYNKIIENNKQIGMVVKERGFISLTLQGAGKIFDKNSYCVKIFDDFELSGSVFAPGVIDADKQIRTGDEVIIQCKNSLAGVGVATMSGEDMINAGYGEAVKTRHHI